MDGMVGNRGTSAEHRRIQFVSDAPVQQIIEGRKTASVVRMGEVDVASGDYDDPLVVGEIYKPAIRCYARCGFTVYGIEPKAIVYGGVFYDELLMAKSM